MTRFRKTADHASTPPADAEDGPRRPPVACGLCPDQPCYRLFSRTPLGHRQAIERLRIGRQYVAGRSSFHHEGESHSTCAILYDGWAFTHQTLPDGRRHVLNFLMPGDVIRIPTLCRSPLDHGCEAITPATACTFDLAELLREIETNGGFRQSFGQLREEEWMALSARQTSLACRNAEERVAFLLLELFYRARSRGFVNGGTFHFPVTQTLMGEAVGLALANTNRVLRRFRREGLIEVTRRALTILDEATLTDRAAIAGREYCFEAPGEGEARASLSRLL